MLLNMKDFLLPRRLCTAILFHGFIVARKKEGGKQGQLSEGKEIGPEQPEPEG
ncbi:hypothetical protein KTAU_11700 [Thermogemmatispora aurantia]|uniref:Uncharacterized protein n=1 Tax=Thermogemmatispora aurantia TaxID=2045279 RepID=A0A5J4K4U8_9CHLR|nr:hypothetical protein KTAU_11700 [Thermogemmatispora aurantia]